MKAKALTFGWGPFGGRVWYLEVLSMSSVSEYHGGMTDNDGMISDEALEAAAATYWNRHYRSSADPEWIDAATTATRADETEQVRRMMRQTLAAAAPYMHAAAWDEGEAAGQDNADSNRGYNIEHKTNPYRSQP